MNKVFWNNKNVLVTGGKGFIGSHLSKALSGLGAKVVVIERRKRNKSSEFLSYDYNKAGVITIIGDLKNLGFIKKICKKEKIDTIFHLAASAIVSQAAKNPHATLENNFISTVNVLEVARQLNIRRVVVASSDKAYGDHTQDVLQGLPYREGYTLRGLDMYSVSKASADTVAQAYALQFKMPVAVLRFCNIYGPGDLNFTRLIPKNIYLLLSHNSPTIKRGHEGVLREYLYIDDAIKAYLIIAEKIESYCGQQGELLPHRGPSLYGWTAFNVGSYSTQGLKKLNLCKNIASVTEVIKLLCKHIAKIKPELIASHREYVEIPDEYLDSSKILKLGYKSLTSLEEGIKKTIAWYKKDFKKIKTLYSI